MWPLMKIICFGTFFIFCPKSTSGGHCLVKRVQEMEPRGGLLPRNMSVDPEVVLGVKTCLGQKGQILGKFRFLRPNLMISC